MLLLMRMLKSAGLVSALCSKQNILHVTSYIDYYELGSCSCIRSSFERTSVFMLYIYCKRPLIPFIYLKHGITLILGVLFH